MRAHSAATSDPPSPTHAAPPFFTHDVECNNNALRTTVPFDIYVTLNVLRSC